MDGDFATSPWLSTRAYMSSLSSEQLFGTCGERHSTPPMLPSRGGLVGFDSQGQLFNTFPPVLSSCTLQNMYHENTRLRESSIGRHKERSGGLGTFPRGVWISIPTRARCGISNALDRPSNGRNAVLSVQVKRLTQIPGVMWEVASTSKVGPTPEGTAVYRMQLLRRRSATDLECRADTHREVGRDRISSLCWSDSERIWP